MSWLTTAQQEPARGELRRDVESHLDQRSRFCIGPFYYRAMQLPDGWVSIKNELNGDVVLNRSNLFKRRSSAIKWISDDIPLSWTTDFDMDPDLRSQFNAGHRVTINGTDYAPHNDERNGGYRIEAYPSTGEMMGGHRRRESVGMSARIYHQDASLLAAYSFTRFADLVRFMTSRTFATVARQGPAVEHPWLGGQASVGSLLHVLREVSDSNGVGGTIFSGRTLTRNDANAHARRVVDNVSNDSPRPDFDTSPYEAIVGNASQDDVFLSFVNRLWPETQVLERMVAAIREIVDGHFPGRRVDVIDADGGPIIAVRRIETFTSHDLSGAPAQRPAPGRPPAPGHPPRYEPSVSDEDFDVAIGEDDDIVASSGGMAKAAQLDDQSDTRSFVTDMLSRDNDSIFYLDEYAFRVGSIVALTDGSPHWFGTYSTAPSDNVFSSVRYDNVQQAIRWVANAAHSIASTRGYDNPAARTVGDFSIERQAREEGFVHSGGYDYFPRQKPPERGRFPRYVIERVPAPNERTARVWPTISSRDADVFPLVSFTRRRDALTYLSFGEYERIWHEHAVPRSSGLSSAVINRVREVSLPPGATLVSGASWRRMDSVEKVELVAKDYDRTALDSLGRDDVGIVFQALQVAMPGIVNDVRRTTGLNATAPSPTLIVVTVPSGGQPARAATPPAAGGQEPRQEPARDFFEGMEPPDDTDDFDVILASSAGKRQRRMRVISFDYDGTTVFPNIDPATGHCPYDEDGEAVSTLNPVAADLMRKHKARGDKVVIVTARNSDSLGSIWRMVRENSLPVSEVYATGHQPKSPTLRSIGASIHYDNSPFHVEEVNHTLYPKTKAYYETDMDRHLESEDEP